MFKKICSVVPFLLLLLGGVACEKKPSSSESSTKQKTEEETEVRTTYLEQLSAVDERIQAEEAKSTYRIGAFVRPPVTRYDPKGNEEPADSESLYLGITLREKRTKRYLPAAGVSVQFDGTSRTLTETWGDVHHYGLHVPTSLLQNHDSFTVSISPPAYGRHAGMRTIHRDPADVTFSLQTGNEAGHPVVSGPSPEPAPPDYDPGSGILKGIEEAVAMKPVGPYRAAFLVEHAEPFWLWSDDGLREQPFEQKEGNHFEIFLVDKRTYVPIPSARITLRFERDQGEPITFPLHPLLAEFYHYGTNHAVPAGVTYKVTATIKPPELHTFEKNRFPEKTITFQWTRTEKQGQETSSY